MDRPDTPSIHLYGNTTHKNRWIPKKSILGKKLEEEVGRQKPIKTPKNLASSTMEMLIRRKYDRIKMM
jgi:hypothetical protein